MHRKVLQLHVTDQTEREPTKTNQQTDQKQPTAINRPTKELSPSQIRQRQIKLTRMLGMSRLTPTTATSSQCQRRQAEQPEASGSCQVSPTRAGRQLIFRFGCHDDVLLEYASDGLMA
jgi:hypothetical protein